MILVRFQGKPFNITVIQICAPTTNVKEAEVTEVLWKPIIPSRTNTKKRHLFHTRRSRDTWNNRQVWSWNTKWSRVKANTDLSREHFGQSKHHLPTTQETTLYMDNTTWLLPKWDRLYSFQLKMEKLYIAVSVQSLYHVRLLEIPWNAAHQASLSFTNSRSLLKLMFIESLMPSNYLILCLPLLLLPSIILIPSIRVSSNELALPTRWPKYQSFSFSIF